MSSFERAAAAVRTMTPPVKPCASRNSRTMPRRRLRSSRDSILRETRLGGNRAAVVRLGLFAARGRLRPGVVFVLFVARLEALELLDGVDDLRDVEERVALQAYVNKGGLHAGQHFGERHADGQCGEEEDETG